MVRLIAFLFIALPIFFLVCFIDEEIRKRKYRSQRFVTDEEIDAFLKELEEEEKEEVSGKKAP